MSRMRIPCAFKIKVKHCLMQDAATKQSIPFYVGRAVGKELCVPCHDTGQLEDQPLWLLGTMENAILAGGVKGEPLCHLIM